MVDCDGRHWARAAVLSNFEYIRRKDSYMLCNVISNRYIDGCVLWQMKMVDGYSKARRDMASNLQVVSGEAQCARFTCPKNVTYPKKAWDEAHFELSRQPPASTAISSGFARQSPLPISVALSYICG